MRRKWIKVFVEQCLRGTMISELTPEQRWVWIGLLLMAGDSPVSGIIFLRKDEDGSPLGYSSHTIAELLGVGTKVFESAVKKMIQHEKITMDEKGVIEIVNWYKYQSDFDRQKPYREGVESK